MEGPDIGIRAARLDAEGICDGDVGERIRDIAIKACCLFRQEDIAKRRVNLGSQSVSLLFHGFLHARKQLNSYDHSTTVVGRLSDAAECRQQKDTGQQNPGHDETLQRRPPQAGDRSPTDARAGRCLSYRRADGHARAETSEERHALRRTLALFSQPKVIPRSR